ncbi:DUF6134 family protein [Dongia sp. agr-C8]
MRQRRSVKRILATLVVVAAAGSVSGTSAAYANPTAGEIDPLQLYGPELRFDVLRNGEKIGQHKVAFRKTADSMRVESRSDLEVNVLFLTAYSFRYHSVENWRRGELTSLDATTNDDGDLRRVEARREGAVLKVRSDAEEWSGASPVWPTTHWNIAQTAAPAVLNTLTGGLNRVDVKEFGVETVMLPDGPRPARRFVYSGDLSCESWYDADNRWVKLRFAAEDGSTIEYLCRNCGEPKRSSASSTQQADVGGAAGGLD